jgi:hypothetical protein
MGESEAKTKLIWADAVNRILDEYYLENPCDVIVPATTGRPRKEIDWVLATQLAGRMMSDGMIASLLGIDVDTMVQHKVWKRLKEFGRNYGRGGLLNKLFEMAMNGNFSAACFLSKQKEILGFTDSHMVQVDQNTLPDLSGVKTEDVNEIADAYRRRNIGTRKGGGD